MLTNRGFAALIVPVAQASYFRLLLRQAELMAVTWLPYLRDQWRAHRSYSLTSLRFPQVRETSIFRTKRWFRLLCTVVNAVSCQQSKQACSTS